MGHRSAVCFLFLSLSLSLCLLPLSSAQPSLSTTPVETIIRNAQRIPQISIVVSLLMDPRFQDILFELNNRGNFTAFLPTNEAVSMADPALFDLEANLNLTRQVILYHVLPFHLSTAEVGERVRVIE